MSVDVFAATRCYLFYPLPLAELICVVYVRCNLPEHCRFEGHFPLVLEVAGSRVAAVRAAKATRSLKCILM